MTYSEHSQADDIDTDTCKNNSLRNFVAERNSAPQIYTTENNKPL